MLIPITKTCPSIIWLLLAGSLLRIHPAQAQRCLKVNIVAVPDLIQLPGSSMASLKDCKTQTAQNGRLEIADYGNNTTEVDSELARTSRSFAMASVAGVNTHQQMPSAQDMSDAKQLAATVSSMTDDQKRQFAMQMAQQQQKAGAQNAVQDDPVSSKMVYQAQQIAISQMKAVNDEFTARLNAIDAAAQAELAAIKVPDETACPQAGPTGMHSCACINKQYSVYWKQKVAIQDKYNVQRTEAYKTYQPKLRALAMQVDATVKKLNYGDALTSPGLKQMLFSSQSSAYANAGLVTSLCAKNIRKSGADAYVSQVNSEHGTYSMACSAP